MTLTAQQRQRVIEIVQSGGDDHEAASAAGIGTTSFLALMGAEPEHVYQDGSPSALAAWIRFAAEYKCARLQAIVLGRFQAPGRLTKITRK